MGRAGEQGVPVRAVACCVGGEGEGGAFARRRAYMVPVFGCVLCVCVVGVLY